MQQNTETSNILTIENLLSAINLSSYFNINIARLTEKEYKKQTQYIQILTMTEKCVCTLCPNFLWRILYFPNKQLVLKSYLEVNNRFSQCVVLYGVSSFSATTTQLRMRNNYFNCIHIFPQHFRESKIKIDR